MQYEARFSSNLKANRGELWRWITSVEGISNEMAPFLRMTVPRGAIDLESLSFEVGKPVFRSWLLLFKVMPFDYSDFTLESIDSGVGFFEKSSMGSMRTWNHVRRISPCEGGYTLTDELTFEPQIAGWLSNKIVAFFFEHRHRKLRRHFGTT
ncbi:hypothetical protein [Litorivivens sp.]|uniref:hypothetical protein n=1 Tax=Litorivivens sp. TaxID=2020868 RepID=UPI0035617087